jgi:hypothetical protein
MQLTSSDPPRAQTSAPSRWRGIAIVLALMISAAAPLWHLHIINRQMPSSHSDLVDEWVAVRDALHGKDPYSADVTRDIQVVYYGRPLTAADQVPDQAFPYPAYLVILFAPLAPLSWETVRLTYLLIIAPLLLLSFLLCARFVDPTISPRRMASIVFLAFCSWPVMWGLRLQQPTLLVAALTLSGCFLLSRERGFSAGILLAFATIKPQLVLPLLLWLLFWACLRRMWSFLASFAFTMALLLLWTEKLVPGWFSNWVAALHGYGHSHGTLPLENVFGHWLGLASTALLVAYTAFLLWRLRRSPARSPEFALAVALAMATAVCTTLTILPVIYNQILLLPACLILVHTQSAEYYPALARRIALAVLVWGYAAIYIAVLGETMFVSLPLWAALPFQNVLLPVLVTIALVVRESQNKPIPLKGEFVC